MSDLKETTMVFTKEHKAFFEGTNSEQGGLKLWETVATLEGFPAVIRENKSGNGFHIMVETPNGMRLGRTISNELYEEITGGAYAPEDDITVDLAKQEPVGLDLDEVKDAYKDNDNGIKAISNWKQAVKKSEGRFRVTNVNEV